MKLLHFIHTYKSRRYLQRIWLTIVIMIVSVLMFTSVAMYLYSKNEVLRLQEEANAKILSQVGYNISYLHNLLANLTMAVFIDNELVPLREEREITDSEHILKKFKMQRYIAATSFLHSIVIYNGYSSQWFTGGPSSMESEDSEYRRAFKRLLEQGEAVKKLEMLPLRVDPDSEKIDLFSYIMYESLGPYSFDESALILNVHADWVFNNIEMVNDLGTKSQSKLFLTDEQGQILLQNGNMPDILQREAVNLAQRIQKEGKGAGNFSFDFADEKQFVSYMTSSVNGWNIINVQPYGALFDKVNSIRNMTIAVTGILLALSVLGSLYFSLRLYRPVGRLVSDVGKDFKGKTSVVDSKDELRYMSSVYENVKEQVNEMLEEKAAKLDIIQTHHIREVINESHGLSKEQFLNDISRYELNIAEGGQFQVGLLRIDNYKTFQEQMEEHEKRLYLFAISNISEEIFNREFQSVVAQMKGDHIVILISGSNVRGSEEKVCSLLKEIQHVIQVYYRLSLTAAVSEAVADHKEISKQYRSALQLSSYRLIFGRNTLMTPSMIRSREEPTYTIPKELEKELVEKINEGKPEGINLCLQELFGYISKLQYYNILHLVLQVAFIIQHALMELNENKLNPLSIDMSKIHEHLLEQETLEEMKVLLIDFLEETLNHSSDREEARSQILVETIKDFVEINYGDVNMNQQYIADKMQYSASYIGRIFKQHEKIPLSQYINNVRLRQSVELLKKDRLIVNDIWEKVGFGSQSYFFIMFKKKYGVTPKAYRLKRSIND